MVSLRYLGCRGLLLTSLAVCRMVVAAEPSARGVELLDEAQRAVQAGNRQRAIELATEVLQRDPKSAEAYYLRGRERFRVADIRGSLADFDRLIDLRPERGPGLWERGIACYYAGRFRDGVQQFRAYQGYDDSDVENAVWHVLCLSQIEGLPSARQQIMKVRSDPRVPMRQIYALWQGEAKPDAVLQAVAAADLGDEPQRAAWFYAHLYLGLYYEAAGNAKASARHICKAAEDYRIGHYMGDVARVHAVLRQGDVAGTRQAP